MRSLTIFIACLVLLLPMPGLAAIDASGLPADSTWYLHADFGAM